MVTTKIKRYFPVVSVVLFSAIVLVAIAVSLLSGQRVSNRLFPLVHAVHGIETETTYGHLWLEEILTGDRDEDIEAVWKNFNQAKAYLQGVETTDVELIPLIEDLAPLLDSVILLAKERYKDSINSSAGSMADREFDRQFIVMAEHVGKLSALTQMKMEQGVRKAINIQYTLIFLIFLLTFPLVYTLVRYVNTQIKHEQELSDKQRQLETFFNSIGDAIMIHPLKDEGFAPFIFVNKIATKRLGYSEDELLQMTAKDIYPKQEGRKHALKESRKQLLDKKQVIQESVHVSKDGKRFPVEVNSSIIEMPNQGPVILSVARDISKRKAEEENRQKLEIQLQQAQKMESIGRLAGGVAHDFNNILSVINGYSELLLAKMRQQDNAEYIKKMEAILASGNQAARLTQQLLAFSRKQITKPEILNINDEINHFFKMLNRLLGEDIEVKIALQDNIWPTKVDRSQLEQILLNIAVNARDAMPEGGLFTIESQNIQLDEEYIEHRYKIEPGDYIAISFTDNGVGMSEEVQQSIFEPFFTTKAEGGTGLGMSIVYGIVQQNNGHIMVYSELGEGTTFKVLFHRSAETLSTENAVQPDCRDTLRGTETLMIVEDNEALRNICADYLSSAGYTILTAKNGTDALEALERYYGEINLLISDVVMPKMGGAVLAEKMTAHMPELKVLFMSGYTEDTIIRHGVLSGGVNFIHKPVTPKALLKAVYALLNE